MKPPERNPDGSDGALVAACRQGSTGAWAVLVRRYTRLVFAVCYGVLGDPDDCEDAVQDVFLKAITRLDRLRSGDRFMPWICRIARNHCLDKLKLRQRRRELLREWPVPQPAERHTELYEALADLSGEYRLPLLLFYFEGHDAQKVGEALGLSRQGVWTRLCRARKQLRQRLEEAEGSR